MDFLGDIAAGFDEMQKKSFNSYFGGGCPICKADNSLDRRKIEDRVLVVCGVCGASFEGILFKGIKLVSGSSDYVDKILSLNTWRIIRFLPEGDCILSSYSDGKVNFYATKIGVIREGKKVSSLPYSDISDIVLSNVWSPTIFHILGVVLFFLIGLVVSAVVVSFMINGGMLFSMIFFALGIGVILLSRREFYIFQSPLLSKKELSEWRIKAGTEEARKFVSLLKERLAKGC